MSVILIVEDDEQVRVLAESVLRDAGYGVLAAAALEGAQALLNSNQLIDLLFVDVNLGAIWTPTVLQRRRLAERLSAKS
jgi:CheY-like chemotaxis protein